MYDIGINSDLGYFFDDTDMHNFTSYVENKGIEEPTMSEVYAIVNYNRYIEYEVLLPSNGKEMSSAKVVIWVKDKNRKVKETYNKNYIIDTRVYDVMFPDGAVFQYVANIIADNMYSQIYPNGRHTLLLKEITDHNKS